MTNHLAELNESNCRPLRLALVALKQSVRHTDDDKPIIELADLGPVMVVHPNACLHQMTICRECLHQGWSQDYYLFTPMGMLDPDDPEVATSIEITKRILGISDPKGAI